MKGFEQSPQSDGVSPAEIEEESVFDKTYDVTLDVLQGKGNDSLKDFLVALSPDTKNKLGILLNAHGWDWKLFTTIDSEHSARVIAKIDVWETHAKQAADKQALQNNDRWLMNNLEDL